MIQVFQIGNISIYAATQPVHDISWKSDGKTSEFMESYRVSRPESRFRTAIRKTNISVLAYADEFRTGEMLYQHFLNISGTEIDVIGYDTLSTTVDISRDDLDFQPGNGELMWYQTRGQIRSVDVSSRNGIYWQIRLDLEIDAYWRPLNRILWSLNVGVGDHHHFYNQEALSVPYPVSPYPLHQSLNRMIRKRPKYWHRTIMTNWEDQFEPEWYQYLLMREPNIPQLGMYTDWSTDLTGTIAHFINRNYWGMPPETLYFFKALPASGTISIEVIHEDTLWDNITVTHTIDLATITSLMTDAGYTLLSTDKLVIGDHIWMPGFILRGSTKLIQIGGAITRTGDEWAGQLLPGNNHISITIPSGISWFMGSINRRG